MERFLKVLRDFESFGAEGIIYGGCLRDTLCMTGPIKDIDIAVPNTYSTFRAIEGFVAFRGSRVIQDTDLSYGNFPDVVQSTAVELEDGMVVNFVVISADVPFTSLAIAERCDFGICQAALTSDGYLYTTPAFAHDQANKTFTFLKDPNQAEQVVRSIRRWERLMTKFPGYTPIIPGLDPIIYELEPLETAWPILPSSYSTSKLTA